MTVSKNTTPNPVTIDWFKNNCTTLENGIAADYSDPINDLTLLESWIRWAETPDAPLDCVEYFYEVSLLKIANSLLTKKYQNVDLHLMKVKATLERLAESCGKQLQRLPESITEIMMTLFQQKHPFYLKYGYPKLTPSTKKGQSQEDQSWTTNLSVTDCIDGRSVTGEWEIIVIDEMSPVGTEISVTWSSGLTEWLRLEDNPRIAKFGTKTGVYSDPQPEAESAPPLSTISESNPITGLSLEDDYNWRIGLSVGTFVDAKDKNGNWYQACILELAHVETFTTTELDNHKVVDPAVDISCEVTTNPMTEHEAKTMAAMKTELFALRDPLPSETNGLAEQRQEQQRQPGGEEVIDLTMDNVTPPPPPLPVSSSDSPPVMVVTTFVRVCFLGWMEYYDDWVELNGTSGRLAPLNSQSSGNRGDSPIREEVKYLAKFWEKKLECSSSPPAGFHYAFTPEPALIPNFYAVIVNQFFISGMMALHHVVTDPGTERGDVSSPTLPLSSSSKMKLIISLGACAEVLTARFFEVNQGLLVPYIERYLEYLLQEELRATKTENLELLLSSFERLLKSMGHSLAEVSQKVDPLWVHVALECIRSPYLNRRLGGLKILTDLLRRLDQAILYPNYLRVARSVPSSSSTTSTSSSSVTALSALTLSSYTFIPPCSIEPLELCQTILTILPPLFLGKTAHEALIQRTSEILKYLCKYNSFDLNLLSMCWDLGSQQNNVSVLQILQELIPSSFSLEILEALSNHIQCVSPPLVTLQMAEIMAAIALRCRVMLLEIPPPSPAPPATSVAPKVQYFHDLVYEDSSSLAPSSPIPPEHHSQSNRLFLHNLHEISLSTLYGWAEDGSSVNDLVALRCVVKVENILELGFNLSLAIRAGASFPWDDHWKRGYQTIIRAVHCLKNHRSVQLAVKTIRAFFLSWAKEDEFLKANIILNEYPFHADGASPLPSDTIPLKSFYRHSVSQYFQENYELTELVTATILSCKEKFSRIAQGIISASASPSSKNAYKLSMELHSVLNVVMIDDSRIGFKDQLECLFDFIQFLVRSSPLIRLSFVTVEKIWNHVLLAAITPQERDLVFSFLNRLIINRSPVARAAGGGGTGSDAEQKNDETNGFSETKEPPLAHDDTSVQESYARMSFFSQDIVPSIYSSLLCHPDFITSDHFSSMALLCVEKYYKWISASNGSIIELPGKDGGFLVCKSTTQSEHWSIFPKIVMYCQEDKVALDAIKFLTAFPQRLSSALVYAGEVIILRQSILSQCMFELEDIRHQALGSHDSLHSMPHLQMKLKRTIMLLNSLLDESSADSSKRIKSHSGKWKNKPVTIKIQYGKQRDVVVTMDTSDTIDDLLRGIAKTLNKRVEQLKFFRRGTELTMNNLIKRTLQQIDVTMNETIVVADRPATSLQSSSQMSQESFICPFDSLPSVILSSKPEYLEILFSLLDITSGFICNDIWELIIRLPTSPQAWDTWKSLVAVNSINSDFESTNSSNLNLFSLNSDQFGRVNKEENNSVGVGGKRVKISLSLSRLIYNLQIIENFLHSSPSASPSSKEDVVVEELDDLDLEGSGQGEGKHQEDVDEDEGLWIGMFMAFGGIKALEDALGYITHQCSLYCHQQEQKKHCGLTSKLLLCALSLITKIFRAIVLRGVICARPRLFHEIVYLVKNLSDPTSDISAATSALSGTSTLPNTVVVEVEMTDDELLERRLNSIEEREQFLSQEWGNKFNDHFDVANSSSSELIESTVNLSQIQATILEFLLFLPKFCQESIFSPDQQPSLNLLTIREQIQASQQEFMLCVQNMFIVWGSVVILEPSLIQTFISSAWKQQQQGDREEGAMELATPTSTDGDRGVSAHDLLSTILTGFPSLASMTSTDNLHRYPSIVGNLSMLGLSVILSVTENCPLDGTNDCNLRKLFFETILDLRPSVTSSTGAAATGHSGLISSDNLFIFASQLLQNPSRNPTLLTTLNLDEERVVAVCEAIYHEFTSMCGDSAINRNQRYCSGKYQNISSLNYFNGNMKLLQSLLQTCPLAVTRMLQQGIADFLINDCLGIRSIDSISLNVMCNDSDSRLQAYNVLRLFLNDRERVATISHRMNAAHATLEEPNQWSFNPVRDMRSPIGYVGLRNMGCTCYMNSLLQVLYMNPVIRRRVLDSPIATASEEAKKDDLLYQLQTMFQFLLHSTRRSFTPEGWMFAYKDETGLLPVNVIHQQDAQEFLQVLCERMEKLLVVSVTSESDPSVETTIPLLSSIYGVQICDQMIKQTSAVENTSPVEEDRSQYIREKNDTMMCLSLDVRGTNGLESSLKKFVSGESLSDYLWEEGAPRVNIIKRQCIGQLSDSVIFHLKRFELNFDTFLREKVNDEFPFPTYVDLYPYTKEGLEGISPSAFGRTMSDYWYELTGIVVHTGTTDSGHYYSYIKESVEDVKDRSSSQMTDSVRVEQEGDGAVSDPPRRWVEFNDSEIHLLSELRIAGECFGGSVAEHEFNSVSQTWLTNNTTNPKSAYMLIYKRSSLHQVKKEVSEAETEIEDMEMEKEEKVTKKEEKGEDETNQETEDMEISDQGRDAWIFPPDKVIRDNQRHLLASRCYTQEHIEFCLSLEDLYLSQHNLFTCDVEEFLLTSPQVKANICDYLTFLSQYVSRSLYHSSFQSGCEIIINLLDNLLLPSQSMPQENQPASSPSSADLAMVKFRFCVEVCQTLLSYFMNAQNGQMIESLLFSPEKLIRMTSSKFLFKLFVILFTFTQEKSEATFKAIPSTIMKSDGIIPGSISSSDLLISSSQGTALEEDIESMLSLPLTIQFLLMVTRNSFFLLCGEHWRRVDGFLSLLLQLAHHHLLIRIFFIRRDLLLQLVDLFLADFSPLVGEYYVKGTRKRAPTSYLTIVPGKEGKLPANAQHAPDWTDLLQLFSLLVISSTTPAMLRNPLHSTAVVSATAHVLDPVNYRLLQTKLLYAHALRQHRYISPMSSIIAHLSLEDRPFSVDCICEVVTEGLSYATMEAIAQYFEILEVFLSIHDTLQGHRIFVLFDTGTPSGSIIQLLKNFLPNSSKAQYICIMIQSLFTLVKKINPLFVAMKSRLSEWAPWILKFCYQFVQKTSQDLQTATATASATSQSSSSGVPTAATGTGSGELKKPKGLYLRIYGEGEEERELNLSDRADKTFDLVQSTIRTMGAHPDTYIPVDAFEVIETTADNDDIPTETLARILEEETKTMDVGTGTGTGGDGIPYSDAMTDEEFARFLASTID